MEILTPQFIETIQALSLPAGLVIIIIILRQPITDILNAGTKKLLHSINGDRIHEEEINKLDLQVNNHMSHLEPDVETLKEGFAEIRSNMRDIPDIKSKVNDMEKELNQVKTDIAILKIRHEKI